MEDRLTKNFTLNEFTYSSTAVKRNIKNIPNEEEYENIKCLCENLLQPLRDKINKPISINSGFRNIEVNKAVGRC